MKVRGTPPGPAPSLQGQPSSSSEVTDAQMKVVKERAFYKLSLFATALEDLRIPADRLFEKADREKDGYFSINEFRNAMKALKIDLEPVEVVILFEHFDKDNTKSISIDEFTSVIEEEMAKIRRPGKPTVSQPPAVQPPNLPQPPPGKSDKTKENMKKDAAEALSLKGLSPAEVESRLQRYLSSITIGKEDRYNGYPSIFNDPIKTLKYCYDEIAKLKNQPANSQFYMDNSYGPHREDPHGWESITDRQYLSDDPGLLDKNELRWIRIEEINQQASFFSDGASPNDVAQGSIGDCWLISALSVIATRDELIRGKINVDPKAVSLSDEEANGLLIGTYPPMFHHLRKHGIYVIRLYKNAWRYVVLDSRLPCVMDGRGQPELIFARSKDPKEFWVPLIEKAFAKIHNSRYQSLDGGQIVEALQDMTSWPSGNININETSKGVKSFNKSELKSPENFWTQLNEWKDSGCLMGVAINNNTTEGKVVDKGRETGLVGGHAYCITGVYTIKDKSGRQVRLIRIRNPWGGLNSEDNEWTGRWSDESTELNQNIDIINNAIAAKEGSEAVLIDRKNMLDGMFFMCFEDFIEIWTTIQVSYKFGPNYTALLFKNAWVGQSAGGCPKDGHPNWTSNPQYSFKVDKKSNFSIHVTQRDGRLEASKKVTFPYSNIVWSIGIAIFKTKSDQPLSGYGEMLPPKSLTNSRNFSQNVELEPGYYIIMPFTMQQRQEGEFLFRVYHNGGNSVTIKNAFTKDMGQVITSENDGVATLNEDLKLFLKHKVISDMVS